MAEAGAGEDEANVRGPLLLQAREGSQQRKPRGFRPVVLQKMLLRVRFVLQLPVSPVCCRGLMCLNVAVCF